MNERTRKIEFRATEHSQICVPFVVSSRRRHRRQFHNDRPPIVAASSAAASARFAAVPAVDSAWAVGLHSKRDQRATKLATGQPKKKPFLCLLIDELVRPATFHGRPVRCRPVRSPTRPYI